MAAFLGEWMNLAVRWVHVISGIMWIGSSLFFNWLDRHLAKSERARVEGELWMVHGGGFYQVEKYMVVPERMPPHLHWFKWEAGFTLLSGWLLLDIVYYMGGGVLLVDPEVAAITPELATAICLAVLVGSWFAYDLIWRFVPSLVVGGVLTFALVLGAHALLAHWIAGRAAMFHVGAMVGTWMAVNVWVHIIPNQKKLVAALEKGEKPSEELEKKAKQAKFRSRTNNYLTYPVVLIMVSNHFPGVYGSRYATLLLAALVVVGGVVRHWQNVRAEIHPGVLVGALAAVLVVAHSPLLTPPAPPAVDMPSDPASWVASQPSASGGPKVAPKGASGTIEGVVRVVGTVPAPKEIPNASTCTPGQAGPVMADALLVDGDKLKNAFVWLKSALPADGPPPKEPVIIDQRGCMYAPKVIGARVGQTVVFLNSDPVFHNVHGVAEANAGFNDPTPSKDTRLVKVFERPEVMVRAKCDVHPWMAGFVGVVPHDYFAVTSAAGTFRLERVPAGTHEVEIWHESFGKKTLSVSVAADATARLEHAFAIE